MSCVPGSGMGGTLDLSVQGPTKTGWGLTGVAAAHKHCVSFSASLTQRGDECLG